MDLNELFIDKPKVVGIKSKPIMSIRSEKRAINLYENKLLNLLDSKDANRRGESLYRSPASMCEDNIYAGVVEDKIKVEKIKKKDKKKEEELSLAKLLNITLVEENINKIKIKNKKKVYKKVNVNLFKVNVKDIPELFPVIGNADDIQYYEDEKIVSILDKHNIPTHHSDLQRLFLRMHFRNKLLPYLRKKENINTILIKIGYKDKPIEVLKGIRSFILLKDNDVQYFPNLTFSNLKESIYCYWLGRYERLGEFQVKELPSNFEWIDKFLSKYDIKIYEDKINRKGFFDLKKDDQVVGCLRLLATSLSYQEN